jgi:signal transduction histidine kinase
MQDDVLALLVHDLKNQLGMLEAELGQLALRPSAEQAHHAHQHCSQLRQRLIAYLTLYASPDRPLTALAEDESPAAFLDRLLRVASRPDGVPLRVGSCADAPAFWYFDPRLVLLALEAALHNAWRFARADVVLDASLQDGFLVLSVEDDGLGLGTPDGSATSSTGLGTELCAAVAHAHHQGGVHGRVTLNIKAGGGTRFEIWLP